MSALILLALLAADVPPPPLVDVAPPPLEESAPEREADVPAQVAFVVVQALHGGWMGLNACGAVSCYNTINLPPMLPVTAGLTGAAIGGGLAFVGRDLAADWGRSLLVNTASLGGALLGVYLASGSSFPTQESRYLTALLVDAALTAGGVFVASRLGPPRPEAVALTGSAAFWGAMLGVISVSNTLALSPADGLVLGALAGAAGGGLLAALGPKVTGMKLLIANGLALLGGLVVGGMLAMVEANNRQALSVGGVPMSAVGSLAGITAGFALGFALSE